MSERATAKSPREEGGAGSCLLRPCFVWTLMEWPGSLSREHLARCRQPTRLSTFATVSASHLPPRAVAMPRPLRAARDLSERLRPYSLGFSNGRHDDVGVSVGASLLGGVGDD